MMHIDIKLSTYINFGVENIDKDLKFEIGNHVRISISKKIFAKECAPNCSEEVSMIKKVKNTVPWIFVISNLNDEEIFESSIKNNCKKQIKQTLGQ